MIKWITARKVSRRQGRCQCPCATVATTRCLRRWSCSNLESKKRQGLAHGNCCLWRSGAMNQLYKSPLGIHGHDHDEHDPHESHNFGVTTQHATFGPCYQGVGCSFASSNRYWNTAVWHVIYNLIEIHHGPLGHLVSSSMVVRLVGMVWYGMVWYGMVEWRWNGTNDAFRHSLFQQKWPLNRILQCLYPIVSYDPYNIQDHFLLSVFTITNLSRETHCN